MPTYCTVYTKTQNTKRHSLVHEYIAYTQYSVVKLLLFFCGLWPLTYLYMHRISKGSVVSVTLATDILDCVIIACIEESIRPVLVQGCKAPNSA